MTRLPLAFGPDSKKEELIDRPITFVTYDKTEEGWCNVGVTGRLKKVAEADIDSNIVQGIQHVDDFEDLFELPCLAAMDERLQEKKPVRKDLFNLVRMAWWLP